MEYDFSADGYLIQNESGWLQEHLTYLKQEIRYLATAYGLEDPFVGSGITLPNGKERTVFYRSLRYLPSLMRLATEPRIIEIAKSVGIKTPLLMNASNIRMDEGGENPHKFAWHQDYSYLLGSANSITFWVPLQKISKELGGLELIPGSHLEGLFDFHAATEHAVNKDANLSPRTSR